MIISLFESVRLSVISLFETVRLLVSILQRNLYNLLKIIKEKALLEQNKCGIAWILACYWLSLPFQCFLTGKLCSLVKIVLYS